MRSKNVQEGGLLWEIELGRFARGDLVEYTILAELGDQKDLCGPFSFTVTAWNYARRIETWRDYGNFLQLNLSDTEGYTCPRLYLSFFSRQVVRVQLSLRGTQIFLKGGENYRVEEEEDSLNILTSSLSVRITKDPYSLSVYKKGDPEPLLEEYSAGRTLSWLEDGKGKMPRVREGFRLRKGERFVGLGERYDELYRQRKKLDVCVYEQYKKQGDRTYLPVPFLLSSRSYGVFLNSYYRSEFDMALEQEDSLFFSVNTSEKDSINLDYYLIFGESPKEIIERYTDITGKPALPPKWAFGPWMSSNRWNRQEMILEQVQRTTELAIPATVLVIEAWSDEATFYIFNDAQYKARPGQERFSYRDFTFPPHGRWPDPKAMVEAIHRQGMRVLLWQIPVQKYLDEPHRQKDLDETYMIEKGYCVREKEGSPYRISGLWFKRGLVVDFTNPQTAEWWLSKREYLPKEVGIDGFKTDGGEHLWKKDLQFFDGRTIEEMRNAYPYEYQKAYHSFVQEKTGGDGVLFSRSGYAGVQAFPCHWAGDEDSTFEAFRASIRAGLSAGVSGMPFWGWDLAGFSGEIPTVELFLRSTAMATFCPIMQYHSENSGQSDLCKDRTPWNIAEITGDERAISVFRKYANLRMNLIPYIYNEATFSSRTGLPLMRPLLLEYPEEKECFKWPYEYFFGRSFLVAPVVYEGVSSLEVYLPPGKWVDFWTGHELLGPQVVHCRVPLDAIPVFVRAGSIVPLNLDQDYVLGGHVGNSVEEYSQLVLRVYPHGESELELLDSEGADKIIRCHEDVTRKRLVLSLPGFEVSYTLQIKMAEKPLLLVCDENLREKRDFESFEEGRSGWYWDARDKFLYIKPSLFHQPLQFEVSFRNTI